MNEIIVENNIKIENMIYEIRGKQVMLDSDLAKLYNVETKRINEAIRNNPEKFPERFAFRITEEEYNILKSKISTSSLWGGSRKGYTVFTEQGVNMLATILKSKVATQVSITIMDAFVEMRKYISTNLLEQKYINNQVMKNTEDIKLLQESIYKIDNSKDNECLFFEGQIYDAYSVFIDILNLSNNEIIIIDNYLSKKLLDILKNINKKIIIVTNKYNNIDYEKYKCQYNNIELIINNCIHDRFIIIDRKILYHVGASMKDLGKKCFAISKIDNNKWIYELLEEINL